MNIMLKNKKGKFAFPRLSLISVSLFFLFYFFQNHSFSVVCKSTLWVTWVLSGLMYICLVRSIVFSESPHPRSLCLGDHLKWEWIPSYSLNKNPAAHGSTLNYTNSSPWLAFKWFLPGMSMVTPLFISSKAPPNLPLPFEANCSIAPWKGSIQISLRTSFH